jgi:hypothetical protein
MVRIYESKRLSTALDRDQFARLLEQKVELANKSVKLLPAGDQIAYREKIDRAYAEHIDRLRKNDPALHTSCVQGKPGNQE